MTRKDFILIANTIAAVRSCLPDQQSGLDALSRELAHRLLENNSRFQRSIFLSACGIPSARDTIAAA